MVNSRCEGSFATWFWDTSIYTSVCALARAFDMDSSLGMRPSSADKTEQSEGIAFRAK